MQPAHGKRLPFGPTKYGAFSLLLGRWLRHHCKPGQYSYISLGGTELKDIENLHFIDPTLVSSATSFESDHGRHILALKRVEELRRVGVKATALNENIFSCSRAAEFPHL